MAIFRQRIEVGSLLIHHNEALYRSQPASQLWVTSAQKDHAPLQAFLYFMRQRLRTTDR
jgi:hypothetical protein